MWLVLATAEQVAHWRAEVRSTVGYAVNPKRVCEEQSLVQTWVLSLEGLPYEFCEIAQNPKPCTRNPRLSVPSLKARLGGVCRTAQAARSPSAKS